MSEVRIVDLEKLGVDIDTFNKIYSMGEEDGRTDAEEEVENRYNRVLDDEKRISYEQGRADAIEECENYLIDSFNRANSCEMLSIGKVIEVFILLFNQLKEQK